MKSIFKTAGAVALALTLMTSLALAGNPNPTVSPPNSNPHGQSYGEWGAAWWQWALWATAAENPVTDTTGQFAGLNQSGQMFFLAGTFGGNAERTVTVPPGKAFCIPLSNWVLTYPEDAPAELVGKPDEAAAWMHQFLGDYFDAANADELLLEVDGVALKSPLTYRAKSQAFSLYMPADCASVTDWGTFQGRDAHYAAGWHYPNVSDGYYAILTPLPAGKHLIHLRVGSADAPYLDVIYHLTIGK